MSRKDRSSDGLVIKERRVAVRTKEDFDFSGPMVRSVSREAFQTLARVAASSEKPTKELRMLMAGRVMNAAPQKKK